MLVTVLVLLWIVGFTAADSSDSAALLKLGTYVPLMGVLGILFVQALDLGGDRPLLPHRGPRRLPLVADAGGADHRRRWR